MKLEESKCLARRAFGFVLALSMLGALPARAGQGIAEINQACATLTGCFAGDSAGWPVTIDASSGTSFLLTSELVVPSSNDDAIAIDFTASGVTIDLNGFEITNLACLHGDCVPPEGATGMGIAVDPQESPRGIVVRNGVVAGMGSHGIRLGEQARVLDVRVRGNGGNGIEVGKGSSVMRSIVAANGLGGIDAGANSNIEASVVNANTDFGIELLAGTHFRDNAIASTTGGPDVQYTGGSDSGPNECSDDSCRSDYRRRFYLSATLADGAGATSACAPGFHLASIYEIQTPAALDYVTSLGVTRDDSGSSVTNSDSGWVRNGTLNDNCGAFTTSALIGSFAGFSTTLGPALLRGQTFCNIPTEVWCVAD